MGLVEVIPPIVGEASSTSTSSPPLARYAPETSPLWPAPATITSTTRPLSATPLPEYPLVDIRRPPPRSLPPSCPLEWAVHCVHEGFLWFLRPNPAPPRHPRTARCPRTSRS